MTPAAVDLIPLPPIEPPTPPAPPPSAAAGDAPSFRDHLQRAERRSSDSDASPRDRSSTGDAPSNTTEARAPQEARDGEKPAEKQPDEAATKSDAVSETKEKQQGEQDSDQKEQEAGAECLVAAVVAPQEIDATELLTLDVVEASAAAVESASDLPAAEQTAAKVTATVVAETAAIVVQTAAIVVQAATTSKTSAEPEATAAPTAAIAELETTVDPAAVPGSEPVVDPATKVIAGEQPQISDLQATQSVVTATPTAPPVAAAVVTEADAPIGDEKAELKTEATASVAPTATVDLAASQVVAVVEAIADAATSDERSQRRDDDRKDGRRVDSRRDSTRTDRPHLPEAPRSTNGREVGGSRAPTSDGSTQLSQSDRVRLVERVVRAVRTAEQRGGDLKIRLSPPELGSLRLQVKLTDGTLSARIEAETPEARQVLVDNLPQLREKLSDQNIRVEKFEIDLFNSGYGGAPQQSREDFDRAMQAAAGRNRNRQAGSEESVRNTTSSSGGNPFSRGDGRLDITV